MNRTGIKIFKIHILFSQLNPVVRVFQSVQWRCYSMGDGGSIASRGRDFFFTAPKPSLGPIQPPIQWVPVVPSPRREADHSPPYSTDI